MKLSTSLMHRECGQKMFLVYSEVERLLTSEDVAIEMLALLPHVFEQGNDPAQHQNLSVRDESIASPSKSNLMNKSSCRKRDFTGQPKVYVEDVLSNDDKDCVIQATKK